VRAVKITKRKKARNSNRKVAIHAAVFITFAGRGRYSSPGTVLYAGAGVSKQPTSFQEKKGNYNIAVVGHIIIANTIGEGHNGNGQQNVL
jgi:hypothetical protein